MFKFFKIIFYLLICAIGFAVWIIVSTPDASTIKTCVTTKMHNVELCERNSKYTPLSQISPRLKNLVIIAEDSTFYSHQGFDSEELKNSLRANLNSKKAARGGSTITQQLAKNVFLSFEKSISRKLREAILSVQIEKILTKDKILEKYLNVIELGPKTFGIKAAAQRYFNKDAFSLNLLESAFIVYLIPNPKVHSRTFDKGVLTPYARYRVLDLCYRMYRFRKISFEQYTAAKEMVDEFPWAGLTAQQSDYLNGVVSETMPIAEDDEDIDLENIPAEDSTLVPLEPPEEIEYEEEPAFEP